MSVELPANAIGVPAAELLVVNQPEALKQHLAPPRQAGQRIGVVPTMGALHEGHVSLMQTARAECDVVVVTIFVNPLQFGPHEDFERYPRPLERDLERCRSAGVDVVFQPSSAALYPPGFDTSVSVGRLSTLLEGQIRPGHFAGVTTVVLKLFQIVEAHVAYFGLKDYQQLAIIRRMVNDLNVPIEIRACPTIRDANGLALSSRNQYLSDEERTAALLLWKSLTLARERLLAGETDLNSIREAMRALMEASEQVRVDYAAIADPVTLAELTVPQVRMVVLVAGRVGETRLIDNLPVDYTKATTSG